MIYSDARSDEDMTLNMNCRVFQDMKAGVGKEGTTLEGDKSSWRR